MCMSLSIRFYVTTTMRLPSLGFDKTVEKTVKKFVEIRSKHVRIDFLSAAA